MNTRRCRKFELWNLHSIRLFWTGWCIFGIVSACYMMSKIWSKWAKNPVLTSVATTNYPVILNPNSFA